MQLEKTFPDTPSVFPHPGVRTLQTALESLVTPMMTSLVVPKVRVSCLGDSHSYSYPDSYCPLACCAPNTGRVSLCSCFERHAYSTGRRPDLVKSLGGTGGEYFRRSRSEMLGVDLDKLCKEEEKPQLLEAWGKFVKTLDELFKAEEGGPWMTGKGRSLACFKCRWQREC